MHRLLKALGREGRFSHHITGLRGSAPALLVSRVSAVSQRPVLFIVPTERQVSILEQDIGLFTRTPIFIFNGYEIPPYTPLSPDNFTVSSRISTLYETLSAKSLFILIASAESLLRRVPPKSHLTDLAELVISGEETDHDELINHLIAAGYESMALVRNVGDFSVRGGIMDIFPPGLDYPVRLDFFGDTIESIRHFDPITQRSVEYIEEVVLLPVSDVPVPLDEKRVQKLTDRFRACAEDLNWNFLEKNRILERVETGRRFPGIEFFLPLFHDSTSTVLDYLPENTLVCTLNPNQISSMTELTWERINANYRETTSGNSPALPPESLFLSKEEFGRAIERFSLVRFHDIGFQNINKNNEATFTISCKNHKLIKQDLELQRKKQGLLAPLAESISGWLNRKDRVFIACRSLRHAKHFAELLSNHDLPVALHSPPLTPDILQDEKGILLFGHPLSEGFDLPEERLHILSQSELFGERRLGSGKKKKKGPRGEGVTFEELKIADIVVHGEHGLGSYQGLVNLVIKGVPNDFLYIRYKGDDRLYVPVDRINIVNKYKGLSDKKPKLDKLGGKAWAATKKKVKKAVWKVAGYLLDLYAKRQMVTGRSFSRPDEFFHELENSFPFDETSDQIKAINDVISDLTSDQPMDRLICGDVGYGKTEIAIRAAFKVLVDSFQVAVLVPTTVLAEQHAETFKERFMGFPVRVESLNRFKSTSQQKKIIKQLAAGDIDIIIGTHRLLSKDIAFKRLGLLIIDEEHRFGVSHKEKLKKFRTRIDVLTLTATPIPRTLQMSLLAVRDLSVINTPPEHRRSVKTFVAMYDDLVIKEAVTLELQRQGQVFLVHNRVKSIEKMAFKVKEMVPEAGVSVAHGQMRGRDLEKIMVSFVNKEIDVLVCTTIIESGLDIPNANTIIITRADQLGLAEIYQLRGRVGRSSEQAYAYLLVPSIEGLSKDAGQRLRALMDYNELGGGFKLALSDLQIRGGGNILGESQSGNIAAVGYDLYLDLLQRTVEDLRKKAELGEDVAMEDEEKEPEINLRISAYIPGEYITDPDQRYIAYKKINNQNSKENLVDLKDEFKDRYGKLPKETLNLFEVMALKLDLKKIGAGKLDQGRSSLVFSFLPAKRVEGADIGAAQYGTSSIRLRKILQIVSESKGKIKLTPDDRLVVHTSGDSPQSLLQTAKKVLHTITGNDN
ncbi:MAG: transcription-repair coupling factor [Thermodesulfobacteriota bacterium]|nr:transcription-repair coupling factor [Thermodesulfobacteriota bacterium]